MGLSRFSVKEYKSSLRTLCGAFFESREKLRIRYARLRQRYDQLEIHYREIRNKNQQLTKRIEQLSSAVQECSASRPPQRLPHDPPLQGHQFGAKMIAFCCALAQRIGFRATEKTLSLIQTWLQVEFDVPSRDTIRIWSSRQGVAVLQQSQVQADDWVWLIDHSVQLGKMCVLIVLGIRQSELPPGRPLRKEDLQPLAVVPTQSRTKEDVASALLELAELVGKPIGVVSDGATELHEGVRMLENKEFELVLIDDVKHKAANLLKRILGKDERFTEFNRLVGKTTASIQQTELDHFLPPTKKTKSRFMNLSKLLDWAEMVRHHLTNPAAPGNRGITPERLQEKLGWLLEYEQDIQDWRECREVVSRVLEFTNREGVRAGGTKELDQLQPKMPSSVHAQRVQEGLREVVAENERKLTSSAHAKLRLPCSTEVLESSLGQFKSLQRHHNRGTFTTLLAIYPLLFASHTPKQVTQRLQHISTKRLRIWLTKAGLDNSTQARKTAAYQANGQIHRQKNNST